jgi:hypothetical protein
LDQKEGENFLKQLHVKPGGMEAYIEFKPEVAQWIGKCLAYIVMKSPNYTEMQYEACGRNTEFKGEWIGPITVTVQKVRGKTPHQLRVEAEKQRDELVKCLEELIPFAQQEMQSCYELKDYEGDESAEYISKQLDRAFDAINKAKGKS